MPYTASLCQKIHIVWLFMVFGHLFLSCSPEWNTFYIFDKLSLCCSLMYCLFIYVRISWALFSTIISIDLTSTHHCCNRVTIVPIYNTNQSQALQQTLLIYHHSQKHQGVMKILKTGCPMGNHLENMVAHIHMKIGLRYKLRWDHSHFSNINIGL